MALQINNPTYGNVFVVADTFDELRSVSSLKLKEGYSAIVAGSLSPADGLGGLFVWSPLSTSADDAETVLEPDDGATGRWLKVAVGQVGPTGTGTKGDKGNPGGNVSAIGTLAQAPALTIPAGADIVQVSGRSAVGDNGAGMTFVYDPGVDASYVSTHPTSSFRDTTGRGFRQTLDAPTLGQQLINLGTPRSILAATALSASDFNTSVECGNSGAGYVVNLPAALPADDGKAVFLSIARSCLVPITVQAAVSSGALIDSKASVVMISGESALFVYSTAISGWKRLQQTTRTISAEMRNTASIPLTVNAFTPIPMVEAGDQLMDQNLSALWGGGGGHFVAYRAGVYTINASLWIGGLTDAPGQLDIGAYVGSSLGGSPGSGEFQRVNLTDETYQRVTFTRSFRVPQGSKLYLVVRLLPDITAGAVAASLGSTVQITEGIS